MGFARRFRPTLAGANMGHPSGSVWSLGPLLARSVWHADYRRGIRRLPAGCVRGASPVVFGPRTLVRTWGTRRVQFGPSGPVLARSLWQAAYRRGLRRLPAGCVRWALPVIFSRFGLGVQPSCHAESFARILAVMSEEIVGRGEVRSYRAPWKGQLVLVCRKCQRKLKKSSGIAKVAKGLKKRSRLEGDGSRLHVIQVPCLKMCPKGGVTVCTQSQLARGECSIVRSKEDLEALQHSITFSASPASEVSL